MTSVKTRFYIIFGAILLTAIAVGWAFTNYLERLARNEVLRDAGNMGFIISLHVKTEFSDITGAVEAMAGSPHIGPSLLTRAPTDVDKANAVLDRYNKSIGSSSVSYLMDDTGKTIASSNRNTANSFVGKSYDFRPYFREAMGGNKSYYFAVGQPTGLSCLYTSFPVRANNGRIIGVVAMRKVLDDIENRLRSYQQWYLTSPDGIILISSQADARLKSLWPLDNETRKRIKLSKQFGDGTFEPLLPGKFNDGSVVTLNDSSHLINRKDIGYGGWSIVVMAPATRILTYRSFGILLSLSFGFLFLGTHTIVYFVKKSAQQLRESESLYQMLANESFTGIYVVQDGVFRFINHRAATYAGYAEAELVGQSAGILVYEEDRKTQALNAREMLVGRRTEPYHFRIVTKEGNVRWIMETTVPVLFRGRPAILGNSMDITERILTEETLLRKTALLEGMNDLSQKALTGETSSYLAHRCLTIAQELTGSAMGFIGELNKEGAFNTIALANPGWEKCKIHGADTGVMIQNMEVRGIWGRIIKTGKSLVENQPSSHPDRVWLPDGHPPINTFLGVPLIYSARTIGMISLANKKSPYTSKDQEIVENLSATFVEALMRKRAEEALEESEKRFMDVMHASQDTILLIGSEKFIDCNEATVRLLGYKNRTEVLMTHPSELSPPEQPDGRNSFEKANEMMKTALEKGYIRFEWMHRKADGEDFPVEVSLTPIVLNTKTVLYCLWRDLTDLKRTERKLKEQEDMYRLLTEKSFAGIYVAQDGVMKFLNANAVAYTGYAPTEIIGKGPGDIVHPEDIKKQAQDARAMLKGLCKTPYEFRIITKQRDIRWIMETVAPFVYENRPAILANCMDITTQKQAEEELQRAYDNLSNLQSKLIQQQKMASIGQLAAGISHEINNPLGFITGNLDVLKTYMTNLETIINRQADIILRNAGAPDLTEALAAEQKRLKIEYILRDGPALIEESLAGAGRISHIVKNLNIFSMDEDAEFRNADISEALSEITAIVRRELPQGVELTASFATLPITRCNIGQLIQAFMAILKNATQAISGKGEIRVETRWENNFIVVAISDTGSGIPNDLKDRIFEPFFTTREVGSGMGLGLSTAYDAIKKHNGEIILESEVGKGSTFTIRIPSVKQ